MVEEFVHQLCNLIEGLSASLTIQYFEEEQQLFLLNTATNNKLYFGNVYEVMRRASQQGRKQ